MKLVRLPLMEDRLSVEPLRIYKELKEHYDQQGDVNASFLFFQVGIDTPANHVNLKHAEGISLHNMFALEVITPTLYGVLEITTLPGRYYVRHPYPFYPVDDIDEKLIPITFMGIGDFRVYETADELILSIKRNVF